MFFNVKANAYYALPLAVGMVFTACADYSIIDEEAAFMKEAVYTDNFEEQFGEIDPNQNWGFDLIPFMETETRISNTNSNEWESIWHYEVPGGVFEGKGSLPTPDFGWARGDVSNYERAYVYWWFSTHQWPTTKSVNWDHYFVENVYGQPEHSGVYSDYTGWAKERFGMEYLKHINKGETPSNSPAVNPITNEALARTHEVTANVEDLYSDINDYNQCGQQKEQVMYEYRTSTEDFIYKASYNNTNKNNWTIQYINGEYYLGMDYWHDKNSYETFANIAPDGYYNDWIVKLSSGTHQVNEYTRRIMCEDLGNSYDWDFNDVVFDVTAFENEGKKVMITLQAAGGTMPIYIGDMNHEAHALFGVSTDTPVNVKGNGVQRPAVVFTLAADAWVVTDAYGQQMLDPNKIPVYVPTSDSPAQWGNESGVLALNAPVGKAPQKFACPCDTYWMQEITDIRSANRENFAKWVKGEITDDSWVISATNNSSMYNPSLHYSDYGKPYSNNYSDASSSSSTGPIRPWKELWNSIANAGEGQGINDPQFVMEREYVQSYDGNTHEPVQIDKRSFIEQAPFIFETVGQDDDPIIFSAMYMQEAINGDYAQYGIPAQERVWPTDGFYTLTLNVDPAGGGRAIGAGTYKKGSRATISTIANDKYIFDRWSTGETNPGISVIITDNLTITAYFKEFSNEFATYSYNNESAEGNITDGTDLFSKYDGLKAKGKCCIEVTFDPSVSNNIQFTGGSVGEYNPTSQNVTKFVTLQWQDWQNDLCVTQGASAIKSLKIWTLE